MTTNEYDKEAKRLIKELDQLKLDLNEESEELKKVRAQTEEVWDKIFGDDMEDADDVEYWEDQEETIDLDAQIAVAGLKALSSSIITKFQMFDLWTKYFVLLAPKSLVDRTQAKAKSTHLKGRIDVICDSPRYRKYAAELSALGDIRGEMIHNWNRQQAAEALLPDGTPNLEFIERAKIVLTEIDRSLDHYCKLFHRDYMKVAEQHSSLTIQALFAKDFPGLLKSKLVTLVSKLRTSREFDELLNSKKAQ